MSKELWNIWFSKELQDKKIGYSSFPFDYYLTNRREIVLGTHTTPIDENSSTEGSHFVGVGRFYQSSAGMFLGAKNNCYIDSRIDGTWDEFV